MDIRKLQRAIVDGLEDVKAQHIAVFNTEAQTPLFERVIVASGTSNRQTKALASSVLETVKGRGMEVLRTEGMDNGEWIIVDCGAAVVHIMQPAIREYYRLEELWGAKKVAVKLGPEGPAKKVAAKSAAPKRAVARKAAPAGTAERDQTPFVKAPFVKPPAKRAPAKKAVAKSAPARKAAPRTPPAKSSAKSPARAPAKAAPRAPAKTPGRSSTR